MSEQALNMDMGSTYQCSHCHCDILSANQLTHDAICARRQSQRPAQPQIIRRESSSGALADPVQPTYSNRRPQIREDKALVNNKLITCPNCEKSIREQNFSSHVESECEGCDKIPCEFCEKPVPMTSYTQHIEDVHRREREQEQEQHQQRQQQQQRQRSNERPVSPVRGMASRQNQNSQERNQPQGMPEQRDRSPGRNPAEESTGGFMGFLKNIITSATQNRSEPNERPQPVEQPQSNTRSILSRLAAGLNNHEEQARPRPMTLEDFFLRAMQGDQNPQRANVQSQHSHNPFMSQQQQQQPRGRSVRTIRFGPHGTLVISNGGNAQEEPEDVWQSVGVPHQRQSDINMGPMADMGPMGLLLQMLAARGQGIPTGMGLSPEQMNQLQEKGLSKEDVESLSLVKYDAEKNKNISEDLKSCPICLDEFEDGVEVRFLWCLHRFHRKCIDQWLEKHTNCPICKKDFSEMNQEFSN